MSNGSTIGDAMAILFGGLLLLCVIGFTLAWTCILPVIGLLYLVGYLT